MGCTYCHDPHKPSAPAMDPLRPMPGPHTLRAVIPPERVEHAEDDPLRRALLAFQHADEAKRHAHDEDPTTEDDSETDETLDDTYEILFDYSLWGEFLVLEVTRTWDLSWEKGVKTTEERSWDVGLDFTPLYVPNLEIVPTYSFTQDVDEIADTTDEEKSIDVDIGYEFSVNDRLVLALDHTYSRTQNWPSDAKMTIERSDDTDLVLTWDEFLRGMGAELSLTRAASDTSGDDKGPEIDYTYSATSDWEILSNASFGFEYNRDVKQESEDTQDFTTTFSVEFLDGRIILDFEHEFDEQLQGERTETHRYLIELQGEF